MWSLRTRGLPFPELHRPFPLLRVRGTLQDLRSRASSSVRSFRGRSLQRCHLVITWLALLDSLLLANLLLHIFGLLDRAFRGFGRVLLTTLLRLRAFFARAPLGGLCLP